MSFDVLVINVFSCSESNRECLLELYIVEIFRLVNETMSNRSYFLLNQIVNDQSSNRTPFLVSKVTKPHT